jgi:hypothetical protein
MEQIILTRSRRLRGFANAILLSALMVFSVVLGVSPILVNSTVIAPGSLPSWNPAVSCTALLTTIEGVIGSQANANGGATYGGGGFIPGIPNRRATSPPCSVSGNATFVEIHGVQINTQTYTIEDCAQYPNGNFCDTTFNAQDPKCTSSDVYLCTIHMEVDQAWKSAGIAPQNPPITIRLLDIQGFVYWDSEHTISPSHSYSGWEIHSVSAWRLSSTTKSDFSLTSVPGIISVPQGSSSTATITMDSLNNFSGTVTLSVSVTPTIANTTSVSLNPASAFIASGGSATSILTVQASQSATVFNYWAVRLKGISGNVTHTLLITLAITKPPPDFKVSANPASMTVSIGSTGTSTITLTSLYNFTGTVSLTASVSPADTTASFSPVNPTASFNPASVNLSANGTGMSTLSVSKSLLTTPGTYTVAITANSGTISHSATVTVTVTV